MILKRILPALAIGIALGAASTWVTPAFSDDKRAPAAAGPADRQWLSIPQIVDKLEAAGYRNIEKIEREHGNYEVRATNRDGSAASSTFIRRQGKSSAIASARATSDERGERKSASADCNERRCRDDLPQSAVDGPRPAGK
jgi:hypothetical protein